MVPLSEVRVISAEPVPTGVTFPFPSTAATAVFEDAQFREEGFAPFTLEFETVRGSGVRRVAGSVLHEQRFFMLLHILLLREPRNIV